MRRTISIITLALAAHASVSAAVEPQVPVRLDAEAAPLANLPGGQVIEVPPPALPGETAPVLNRPSPVVQPVIPVAARQAKPESPASERKTLGHPGTPTKRSQGAPAQSTSDAVPAASWTDHWLVRTVFALVCLGALLGAARWFMLKIGPGGGLASQLGAGGRAPQGVMEVLGRYPVSRGHSLVLLKMDRRVLLLGQSPAGFTTLSELTDAEDVASILTKTADAEGRSMTHRFGEILRGMERDPSIIDAESGPAETPTAPRLAMRLAGANQPGGAL